MRLEIEAEHAVSAVRAGLRIAEIPGSALSPHCGQSNVESVPPEAMRVVRTVLREYEAAHRA